LANYHSETQGLAPDARARRDGGRQIFDWRWTSLAVIVALLLTMTASMIMAHREGGTDNLGVGRSRPSPGSMPAPCSGRVAYAQVLAGAWRTGLSADRARASRFQLA
jgi:hypothetical protein